MNLWSKRHKVPRLETLSAVPRILLEELKEEPLPQTLSVRHQAEVELDSAAHLQEIHSVEAVAHLRQVVILPPTPSAKLQGLVSVVHRLEAPSVAGVELQRVATLHPILSDPKPQVAVPLAEVAEHRKEEILSAAVVGHPRVAIQPPILSVRSPRGRASVAHPLVIHSAASPHHRLSVGDHQKVVTLLQTPSVLSLLPVLGSVVHRRAVLSAVNLHPIPLAVEGLASLQELGSAVLPLEIPLAAAVAAQEKVATRPRIRSDPSPRQVVDSEIRRPEEEIRLAEEVERLPPIHSEVDLLKGADSEISHQEEEIRLVEEVESPLPIHSEADLAKVVAAVQVGIHLAPKHLVELALVALLLATPLVESSHRTHLVAVRAKAVDQTPLVASLHPHHLEEALVEATVVVLAMLLAPSRPRDLVSPWEARARRTHLEANRLLSGARGLLRHPMVVLGVRLVAQEALGQNHSAVSPHFPRLLDRLVANHLANRDLVRIHLVLSHHRGQAPLVRLVVAQQAMVKASVPILLDKALIHLQTSKRRSPKAYLASLAEVEATTRQSLHQVQNH